MGRNTSDFNYGIGWEKPESVPTVLYHGTTADLTGTHVLPQNTSQEVLAHKGLPHSVAWASNTPEAASLYSQPKTGDKVPYTIYKVAPLNSEDVMSKPGPRLGINEKHFVSPSGFRILGVHK